MLILGKQAVISPDVWDVQADEAVDSLVWQ